MYYTKHEIRLSNFENDKIIPLNIALELKINLKINIDTDNIAC